MSLPFAYFLYSFGSFSIVENKNSLLTGRWDFTIVENKNRLKVCAVTMRCKDFVLLFCNLNPENYLNNQMVVI